MIITSQKSDYIGALASSLCLIHCVATPLIFIAQTCTITCCEATPIWWKFIDYIFLAISFFAIIWSTKTTTITWVKPMLWTSWLALVALILNENLEILPLPEIAIYVPALALVILHLYNKKYCGCVDDKCCVNEK